MFYLINLKTLWYGSMASVLEGETVCSPSTETCVSLLLYGNIFHAVHKNGFKLNVENELQGENIMNYD